MGERDTYGQLCLVKNFVTDMEYTKWTYFDSNGNNNVVSTVITPSCDELVQNGQSLEYTGDLNTSNEDRIVRSGTGSLVCSNGDMIFSKNWDNGGIPDGKIAKLTVCSSDYTNGECKDWEGVFMLNAPDCMYGFDYYHVRCGCPDKQHYVNGECKDSQGYLVPSGGIIMWSGSASAIPTGWSLCDGTNGTPDLRNRFVVGGGSSYGYGSTGGAASQ